MALSFNKIFNNVQLDRYLDFWREEGEEIVFTNGCFDLIHLGHIDYLEQASQMGTKLVVGLNSDDSVRRLKGDSRPILDQTARARIIAALEAVAAVVIFDEDTPLELIQRVRPKVLVKGADYAEGEVVGAKEVREMGGTVELIPLVTGYSTSAIVLKIKNLP